MKFLLVLFLAGLSLAAASNFLPHAFEDVVQFYDDQEDFNGAVLEAEDDVKEDLKEMLKERFDEILEKVKEALENGKGLKDDTLKKLKDIREKLKDLKVDLGDQAKELIEKLKEKAKDYWQKILDRLGLKDSVAFAEDPQTELGKKLRDSFDEILEKVKEAIENGKGVKEDTIEKLKEIRQKLKDLKVDLSNQGKELLEKLKEKVKDYWQKILDKLRDKTAYADDRSDEDDDGMDLIFADDDVKEDLKNKLKDRFDEILEKVKEALDNGKGLKDDTLQKLQEIREKLRDLKVDLGDKGKELIEKLKEKAKDYWQKILDRLGLKDSIAFAEDDPTTELGKKLKEHFDEILEKIKEAIDNGKVVKEDMIEKLKEIRQKLKDLHVDLSKHGKELLEKLKDKVKDFWQKILDKLQDKKAYSEGDDLAEKLRERFEEILEKIKDAIENGKLLGGNVVAKLREIYMEMKEKSIPFGDKAKELLEQLREKATGIWKRILDKINPSKRSLEARGTSADNLRQRLQELLEKLRESFRNRKLPGRGFIAKLKQVSDEIRERKVPLGGKLRDMIEKLKENANSEWRRILDRIGQRSHHRLEEFEVLYGTSADNLRQRLQELLEKLRESFRNRKLPGKGFIAKLKQVRDEMRDRKVPLGGKLRDMIEKLKENANSEWRRILDRIGQRSPQRFEELEVLYNDGAESSAENLRERMQEMLDKLRDAFRERKLPGKGFISKLRQIRQEMRDKNVPLGGKLRDTIAKLKENSSGIWRRILDRLGRRSPSLSEENDFASNLRERFEEILGQIKDVIENRKFIEVNVLAEFREIYNQMMEKSIPFGDEAMELLEQLKEKATGLWKKILNKINPSQRSQEARGTGAENLRDRLQELLEKLRESFRDRKLPGKGFIAKLREVRDEMRQKNVPLGGKLREMIEKLKENANGVWRRILDRIGQRSPQNFEVLNE